MLVGHNISPGCTSTIQYAIVDNDPPPREGRRVIIVDTPGFNDYNEDNRILQSIATWLKSS